MSMCEGILVMFLGVPVTLIGRNKMHLCGNSVFEAAVLIY